MFFLAEINWIQELVVLGKVIMAIVVFISITLLFDSKLEKYKVGREMLGFMPAVCWTVFLFWVAYGAFFFSAP